MNFSEIELPSNKKFGYFFTVIFLLIAAYYYFSNNLIVAYILLGIGCIFLLITFTNDNLLLPLNKLWMRFGMLIGMIVSPVVMGIIFFGLFTPMSLTMRLFGRDELRIRFKHKATHWILRNHPNDSSESFKHQF